MSTDLHRGFADVDHAAKPQTLSDFLELANSLPEIRAYKRVLRSALELQSGDTLLDVGCGLGIEAGRIARDHPDVSVIGLDREAMLAEARDRAGAETVSVRWVSGQAEDLPLSEDSIDACITERVLKYLPDPARGIAEMARVLKPGGRIACFELDYAAPMLGGDPAVAALVNDLMNASVSAPRMGRRLPSMFQGASLTGITTHPVIFCPPWPVYQATIDRPVRDAIARGDLPREQTAAWLQSQADAANEGSFYAAFIGMVVSARMAS